jgi:phage terminase small subunit
MKKKKIKRMKNLKQKKVVEGLVAGKTAKQSMLDAGYSENYASQPSNMEKKKSFQELLDEVLPEDFVLDQHRRLYGEHRHLKQIRLETTDPDQIEEARKGYESVSEIVNEDEGYTLLIVNEVDRQARKDAVELAYKLRGSFSPTKLEVKREYEDLSDEEIFALLKDKE